MSSLHVIVEATSGTGKRIVGARVRIYGIGLDFGCAGFPLPLDVTVTSDERGVANYDLGNACGIIPSLVTLEITVTTPKGKTARKVTDAFWVTPAGDYIFSVLVNSDEGSAGADVRDEAAVLWEKYGTWIVVGGVAIAALLIYGALKRRN